MFFKQVPIGPMQNFSYIIGDENAREAAVVDAGWDVDKLIETAKKENLEIKKIIFTHSHYDHVQKVDELASKTNTEVYFHELEFNEIKKYIKNPNIKLIKVNDNIEIYPGHDYGKIPFSTIGNEKKNNPYFKCETKEQFLSLLGMF